MRPRERVVLREIGAMILVASTTKAESLCWWLSSSP
jgi:hypothetical protein